MLRSIATASVLILSGAVAMAANDAKTGSLNKKDASFLKDATVGAMAEVEMGKLAQQNGSDAAVKEFGQRMVTDHGTELTELKSLAQSKGLDLPMELDKKHQSMHDKMSKLSGADFDKAYAKDMLKDHKEDLATFKKEADKAHDPDVKAFAAKQVPVLEEHLSMAEKLPANSGEAQTATHREGDSKSHDHQSDNDK